MSEAISLLPLLESKQAIRASNLANSKLRQLFMRSHKLYDFTQGAFLGLDITQRIALIEQVSSTRNNDKEVARIAVLFFYAQQNYQRAYEYLQLAITDRDLAGEISDRDQSLFEIYLEVLMALDRLPTLQKQLSDKLRHNKDE